MGCRSCRGNTEGPEVDGLRAALKCAKTAAQGVPIDKQVKDCEAFLSRARAHLEELEQKRSAVVANISAAEQRLVTLKMQQDCPPPPTGHQCRGAKIAGFGESFASIVVWRRSRHSLWTRCETAMSCGTGVCSCALHSSQVERVVGGAPCRSPRCIGE